MEKNNDIREAAAIIEKELSIKPSSSSDEFLTNVAAIINELIQSDFSALILLLYRLDIDENKLRTLLAQQPSADAGLLIGDLILQRQLQKIKTRREFHRDNDIDEDERW